MIIYRTYRKWPNDTHRYSIPEAAGWYQTWEEAKEVRDTERRRNYVLEQDVAVEIESAKLNAEETPVTPITPITPMEKLALHWYTETFLFCQKNLEWSAQQSGMTIEMCTLLRDKAKPFFEADVKNTMRLYNEEKRKHAKQGRGS